MGPKSSQTGLIMAAVTGTTLRSFSFCRGRLGPGDTAMYQTSCGGFYQTKIVFFVHKPPFLWGDHFDVIGDVYNGQNDSIGN